MTYEPQHFRGPDGTELVVITRDDYERLAAGLPADDDARDIDTARAIMAASSGFAIPLCVVEARIAGESAVAAWRKERGMTQAQLAAAAGVTQTAIARLESAPDGSGRPATRRAIAAALGLPGWALEQD
ncbi:MAG TPA: helix-turn-helix transcriptional regulator [Sphingomonas sp.]|jgi:DNA-binding XRE family transcriptional regulator|uniref:helix-turn-helix transcriptional regulator n=1 Tax=Sphingomonas sp. TaxID=28214 RepID=UPI002ED7F894